MRKAVTLLRKHLHNITFALVLMAIATSAWAGPVPPVIAGHAAVLIDAVYGKVLYEKACHARMSPASTTKIMTATLALEHSKLTDTCTASAHACQTPFGNLHLKPGETLDLQNLMCGTLLRSANDGAMCIAEHVAGSEPEFVRMMNAKAKEIGAKDTHFVNPHGLYNKKHYSTAYDLAMIARYAVKVPGFNDFVCTRTARIERSINTKDVFVKNTARFLWKYDGADGIKTGYTKEAGRCFVGSATRDGWRLITVVLKSPDAGKDTAAIMDYGFKFFKPVCYAKTTEPVRSLPVAGGVVEKVDVFPSKDLALVIKKDAPAEAKTQVDVHRVVAPIKKGDKLGTLTAYLNGRKVGTVDLIAAQSVDRTFVATALLWLRNIMLTGVMALVGLLTYGTQAAKVARRRRRGLSPRR
jgi:D-alanyl-D-alanine carboxypeptidase (penicillin-binding protein 5/6)